MAATVGYQSTNNKVRQIALGLATKRLCLLTFMSINVYVSLLILYYIYVSRRRVVINIKLKVQRLNRKLDL